MLDRESLVTKTTKFTFLHLRQSGKVRKMEVRKEDKERKRNKM